MIAAIAVAMMALSALAGPMADPAAAAVETAAAEPAPPTSHSAAPDAELAAPATTISTDPAGFSGTGSARVTGAKQADNGVIVTLESTGERLCTVPADALEAWDCGSVALPNGSGITLQAVETLADGVGERPTSGSTTIDVLRPPTMGSRELTTGPVSGSGRAGSFVSVYVNGAVSSSCARVPVSPGGSWSCNTLQPSGTYDVRARQSDPSIGGGALSAESNRQVIAIDRDAPASAVITAPRDGGRVSQQPSVVFGTGENGAWVDVYVDNVPACAAVVSGGAWGCSIGELARGHHALHTVQRDAAGNFGSPSRPIRVFFGASSAAAPVPTPAPSAPLGTPTPVPEPGPGSSAPVPPDSQPDYPEPDGSGPTLAEALTNWGTPTGFGSGLDWLRFGQTDTRAQWYTAPLLGILFLVLVALPLRMLASALRGRITIPRGRLTGRNQGLRPSRLSTVSDAEVPKPVNAWLAGAVPLAAAAALIVLTGGLSGEVRYLRLFLAVGLGLTILNIVGASVATRLGSRWNRVASRLRFLPLMLLAAALAAFFSRWSGMDPPLVVGVLAGAVFAAATPVRQRALVNLTQVGVVVALGLVGWLAFSLLGPVEGFWSSVASETFATLCLAGMGSALVLVLPLATLPGRVILEWSPPVWLGTVLVVATVVAAVVFGGAITSAAVLPWILTAGAFATLSVATWAFVRYVEPQLV